MLCALTVRKLQPGAWEDFKRCFLPDEMETPPGWSRFFAIRNVADEDEVVTFGFFDGTLEELRANQQDNEYDQRRAEAEQYVVSVGADGIFEVIDERAA